MSIHARRACIIVLDACGAGEAPDSVDFGDSGADTLGHVAEAVGGLQLPNLQRLGLGATRSLAGCLPPPELRSIVGTLTERSLGKDTTTGHWELVGVLTTTPPPTYPDGFPQDIVSAFVRRSSRGVLGNCVASGTEIIDRYGPEHLRTGDLIVYTSADSVFQIAAHEELVPPAQLYAYCEMARELLTGEHAVSRVIARPFVGEPGAFERTGNRRDFSLQPPGPSHLTALQSAGKTVVGVGKIGDIFAMKGIDEDHHTDSNQHGIDVTIEQLRRTDSGDLIFTNLVETDMLWGHRRDAAGFHGCLQEFDRRIPEIEAALRPGDLFIVTADHGCDPTYRGSDHTRELVPLVAQVVADERDADGVSSLDAPRFAGRHDGYFSDVGATVCAWLGVTSPGQLPGVSFIDAGVTA
ncbi:MAG: phosphopentomutase [Thermoleophilia bacterium]|nr:phosphopentomutase [Thermoleophilia bacterium]